MFVFELNSRIKCRVERNFATLPQNEFKVRRCFQKLSFRIIVEIFNFFTYRNVGKMLTNPGTGILLKPILQD